MTQRNGILEDFYRAYRQQLFTYALAITRCPERAEDAIQEAFYRLFRLTPEPAAVKAYVFRAVRNAALDQSRRAARAGETIVGDSLFDPEPGPQEETAARELRERAAAALRQVSDGEREAIVLHLYGDLTFREIAELCAVPLGTVTARYQRGLRKLRELMEATDG